MDDHSYNIPYYRPYYRNDPTFQKSTYEAGDGGPYDSLCDLHRWTLVSSSEDVVRVTSKHFALIGVPDHITLTTKVLCDNSWEVSVISPQQVPVMQRLSFLEITTNCLLVVSCLKCLSQFFKSGCGRSNGHLIRQLNNNSAGECPVVYPGSGIRNG